MTPSSSSPPWRVHLEGVVSRHDLEREVAGSSVDQAWERHLEVVVPLAGVAVIVIGKGARTWRQHGAQGDALVLDARSPHAIFGGTIGLHVVVGGQGRAQSFA
jgi:hypothetical protein